MKKLCILLPCFLFLAAFAPAQTPGFRILGIVETGATVFMPDGKEATIAAYSPWEGVAARTTLLGRAANFDGTVGANFEIRAEIPYDPNTSSLYFQSVEGWLKFWDKRITLIGGKVDNNGPLRTFAGFDEDNMVRNDLGVHLRMENLPLVPNLMLGVTVFPGVFAQMVNETNYDNTLGKGNYKFALRYLFPQKVSLLAMFFDNAQTDLYQQDRLHFITGVDVIGLRPKGFAALRADFALYDLQDSGYINMKAGQFVVWRRQTLELGFRGRQFFLLGDQKNEETYSPEYLFRVWGQYGFLGNRVRARLDAGYLAGGYRGGANAVTNPRLRLDGYESMNGRRTVVDPTRSLENEKIQGFEMNAAYFSLTPQVEFRFMNNGTAIIIGGGPLFDLSAGDEQYNYFAFACFRARW